MKIELLLGMIPFNSAQMQKLAWPLEGSHRLPLILDKNDLTKITVNITKYQQHH
jgi:hypothetical protein